MNKSQTTVNLTMDSGITPNLTTQPSSTINSNSSGASSINTNSSGISSITQATTVQVPEVPKKNEQPLATTMHYVQGFGLVMLCNCRSYPRKLAVNILKEVKNLIKALGLPETEPPLIDVIDKCCPQVTVKDVPKFFNIFEIVVNCCRSWKNVFQCFRLLKELQY